MNTDPIIQEEINRLRDEVVKKYFHSGSDDAVIINARKAIDEFTKRLQEEILSEEREIDDLKRENKSWREQRETEGL